MNIVRTRPPRAFVAVVGLVAISLPGMAVAAPDRPSNFFDVWLRTPEKPTNW